MSELYELCLLHAYVPNCLTLAVLYLIIVFSSNLLPTYLRTLLYSTSFYSFVPQLRTLLPSSLPHQLFLELFFATVILPSVITVATCVTREP